MDAEKLKALLQDAVAMGKKAEEKNVVLEAKAEKLETKQSELLVKFEAMSKQIEDGGGKNGFSTVSNNQRLDVSSRSASREYYESRDEGQVYSAISLPSNTFHKG